MPTYPNRCQHIKVNGTQCGSPALRRNRFCYFHKRHHQEQIQLNLDRTKNDRLKDDRRRRTITIDLPVLEDANSIQVSLMQIMRLLITGQIEGKTASLLLYALQTASSNLNRTSFNPLRHDVILDPSDAHNSMLGEQLWSDSDFEEEEDDDEEDAGEDPARKAGIQKAAEYLYNLEARNKAKAESKASDAALRAELREKILKELPPSLLGKVVAAEVRRNE